MRILFFGDSITDAGRNRLLKKSLGKGYVKEIYENINSRSLEHEIINKGISGNRIIELEARLKTDVWKNNPELISILVGVNDVWHGIAHNNGVDIITFEEIYDKMIADTMNKLPSAKIILCEPFVLKGAETAERYAEFLEVKKYARVVEKLSAKYGVYYLPLQQVFDNNAKSLGADNLLVDGVHPTELGAKLIAKEWLELFNGRMAK